MSTNRAHEGVAADRAVTRHPLDNVCAVMDTGGPELGARDRALSVAELYGQVRAALNRSFPASRTFWVRGEIHSLSEARSGHCYLELIEPDGERGERQPVLKVNCWSTSWTSMKKALGREGIVLEQGMVILLRGRVELYAARGQVCFIAQELDVTALLGRLAARRAALVRLLTEEGLLRRNASLPVPAVPLRIALVASPRSEGYNDFLKQVELSGLGFHIGVAPASVQGKNAPGSLVVALRRAIRSGPDLVVVVRGGGSRADLAVFDAEPVARAIATCPVPVWTGIGHTGDQSVADLVAGQAFVTPTECGQELVRRVEGWWGSVTAAVTDIGRAALAELSSAERRSDAVRGRLAASARHYVLRGETDLQRSGTSLAEAVPRAIDDARTYVAKRSGQLGPLATGRVRREEDAIAGWRRLIAAYDVNRQLERGYTLTLDADGVKLRSIVGLEDGAVLTTRFADGSARSVVESVHRPETRDGQRHSTEVPEETKA